jgi:lysophospholipase L1-like esterase
MKIKTATLIQLALAYEGVFAHGQDKNDSEHGGLEHQVRGRSLSNEASAYKTYLALGDSIPAGTKDRDQIQSTVTTPFKDNSYPQFLYNRLLDEDIGFHSFVNLACPLETSAEMLNGDLETELSPTGSACYGETSPMAELSPSITALVAKQGGGILKCQLEAAKIVLATQDVGLVTVTVGGNDVLESCPPREIPQDELPACISKQLSLVAANLYTILGTIQGIAPGVPCTIPGR